MYRRPNVHREVIAVLLTRPNVPMLKSISSQIYTGYPISIESKLMNFSPVWLRTPGIYLNTITEKCTRYITSEVEILTYRISILIYSRCANGHKRTDAAIYSLDTFPIFACVFNINFVISIFLCVIAECAITQLKENQLR